MLSFPDLKLQGTDLTLQGLFGWTAAGDTKNLILQCLNFRLQSLGFRLHSLIRAGLVRAHRTHESLAEGWGCWC